LEEAGIHSVECLIETSVRQIDIRFNDVFEIKLMLKQNRPYIGHGCDRLGLNIRTDDLPARINSSLTGNVETVICRNCRRKGEFCGVHVIIHPFADGYS